MNTNLLKLILLIALTAAAVGQVGPPVGVTETTEELAERTFAVDGVKGIDYRRIEQLQSSERDRLIKHLRKELDLLIAQGVLNNPHWSDQRLLDLALLGDDFGRETLVNRFWVDPRHSPTDLLLVRDARVIAAVGEGLFYEDEWQFGGDFVPAPRQILVAKIVVETLERAPGFNADVVAWAKTVDAMDSIGAIRKWYVNNKDALTAGRLEAVLPGPKNKAADRNSQNFTREGEASYADGTRANGAETVWNKYTVGCVIIGFGFCAVYILRKIWRVRGRGE